MQKEFLQSDYQGMKVLRSDGWEVEYIEASKQTVMTVCNFSMIACMPLMKVFKYCYIPRGFYYWTIILKKM